MTEKQREYNKKYYQEHRKELDAKNRKWYEEHPDRRRELARNRMQRWRAANPEKEKEIQYKNDLKRKYGISVDKYDEMYEKQNGCCAGCGEHKEKTGNGNGRRDVLCVDHDHITDQIRELLCIKCNSILGLSNDNIELLENMITYIEKHK